MNKKRSSILLIVTLGIWGILLYRIIRYYQAEDVFVVEIGDRITAVQDTIPTDTLLLNYPDPFSDEAVNRSDEPDLFVPDMASPPSLVYLGMVNNRTMKKSFACIRIGNNQLIVKKNEIVNGIRIVAIYRDSLAVDFNSHFFTFSQNVGK
ncbi:MAG: hypothetical protein PHQ65_08435 [Bacteroidales bacterium]|nr:hypothetical protein [Bacteroidales bacterium]MDD3665278.1 hypothetical protein [Bacteroidales bacterium]